MRAGLSLTTAPYDCLTGCGCRARTIHKMTNDKSPHPTAIANDDYNNDNNNDNDNNNNNNNKNNNDNNVQNDQ